MQSDPDAVRANLPPFPRLAAGAEILDVNLALDHHGGAERHAARLHHPAQQRRRPIGTEHLALLQVDARAFHHVPAGRLAEQRFCKFNWHSNQYAGGMRKCSRTQGVIPICSSCKKIRNYRGYWTQLETYLGQHTNAEFSHGLCVDCLRKLYPDASREVEARPANQAPPAASDPTAPAS